MEKTQNQGTPSKKKPPARPPPPGRLEQVTVSPQRSKTLFCKEGVFIHTTVARADEDALVAGKIFLVQKSEGLFVEWKALEDEYDVGANDNEWAVVDAVSYNRQASDTSSVSVNRQPAAAAQPSHTKKTDRHKYVIHFELTDLKSFKRSRPNLGWSYLIFILKCGTTCPALHFHQGGTKAFIKEMEKYLTIKRSPTDSCLYLVREHDPAALSKSFDELQLFEEQGDDVLSTGYRAPRIDSSLVGRKPTLPQKFIHDPYTTTLGGFSKVTNFLRDVLVVPENMDRPQEEVAEILQEGIEGMAINNQQEPGFEMVTCKELQVELPARTDITRGTPMSPQQWSQHMNKDGVVQSTDKVKEIIFRGGVDPTIRIEVWKFLLDYYKWDSTHKSRSEERKKKVDDYFTMKLQWKSVGAEQEKRFALLKERKNLIDKDVTRTDRTHSFFQGDDNPNLQVLYDILMTYCMYNFDLGYVQGMSDLLAPILVVMENEVDAFWTFAGFMEQVEHNFEMDQEGMKRQLLELHTIVKFMDPELCNYLESHDSSNMYFCFRWLLIIFKREFSFPDCMRLWEVLWTGRPCKNYHLLICVAILDTEKSVLIENNFGFTEILKHINDISGAIDLESTLKKAEAIYMQLYHCKKLPQHIEKLFGLQGPPDPADFLEATMQNASRGSSSPTTPERQLSLPLKSAPSSSHSVTNGTLSDPVTTPDDSSIEILPDHMDIAY